MGPTDACDTENLAGREVGLAAECSLAADSDPFLLGPEPNIGVRRGAARNLLPSARTEPGLSFRLLDVTVAGLMLVLVLPLMSICVLAIRLGSPGPVIFRQTRIGQNGREFTCLKFRTMIECAEHAIGQVLGEDSHSRAEWAAVRKLYRDPRVTRVGHFMRRYCVDELPQLFNVLRGEMSIVGPRPIVAEEIHRYGSRFTDYCSVKPGLTGLWQVSGLHALPYSERVRLDAEYASSKTVSLDLLILWKTVPIVLFGRNDMVNGNRSN